jgi:uncharacterized protein YqjF (DUF2071 family)
VSARPFLAMDWRDVLFLHWPVDARELRSRIPADLELDTYDGTAWVSVVAFRIAAARPYRLPAALALPAFGEINVRTYVRGATKDGVWFFSLDAASRLAVAGGRRIAHLPYFNARIDAKWTATACRYRSERRDHRSGAATFAATARFGGDVRIGAPGSLDAWLVERYCFYTVDPHGHTVRGDVRHAPWLLRDATAELAQNTLLSTAGITPQTDNPLVHISPGVTVQAWPLSRGVPPSRTVSP